MAQLYPVTILESEHNVYFQSEKGFLLRLSNSVTHEPQSLWSEQGDKEEPVIYPQINESSLTLTKPWDENFDSTPVQTGSLQIITDGISSYVIGSSNAPPAYSPYYIVDTQTEQVYSLHDTIRNTSFDGDNLLNLEAKEEYVSVKNEQTGNRVPIEPQKILENIGSKYQYVLPIQD